MLAVQGLIGVGFLAFMLAHLQPFPRLDPAPLDGNDLNPLLQDPGLAFHPPLLYLGYVGFSIAFSFAVAALIEGRVDAAWARWVRPWTLAAWTALTLGIALGSWWAYYELGWGGWWFWDPVENASFMPWLVGDRAAALGDRGREARRAEELDHPARDPRLRAVADRHLPGALGRADLGARLRQSIPGAASSSCMLLAIAIGGALALYAWRAPAMKAGGLFAPISREGALVLNNLLLATAAATVFLGTLYPLFLDVAGGGTISVGPPFFNATFVPLMVPLVAGRGGRPVLAWKRGDLLARAAAAVARRLAAVARRARHAVAEGRPRSAPVSASRSPPGWSWARWSSWAERTAPVPRAAAARACAARAICRAPPGA